MATVHLVGGEKGGVGKSMTCFALSAYLVAHNYDFYLFDGDRGTPDVYRAYQKSKNSHIDCRIAFFSEGKEYDEAANAIFNAGAEKLTLVNLPANNFPSFKKWVEKNRIFHLAELGNIQFKLWFVSDGSGVSFNHLVSSLNYFDGRIAHVLVKNYGKCEKWDILDSNQDLKHLIEKYEVKSIEIPEFMGVDTLPMIRNNNIPFEVFAKDESVGLFERLRARSFLEQSWDSISKIAAFSDGD